MDNYYGDLAVNDKYRPYVSNKLANLEDLLGGVEKAQNLVKPGWEKDIHFDTYYDMYIGLINTLKILSTRIR